MTDRITFAGSVAADGRRLRGSVVLAGARTFRNGEWLEVDPAALVKADAANVVARFDHDPSKVLARTLNETLSIKRTDQGIEWETAELPNTSYANDTLELARGGYLAGSSFEIEGLRSAFSTDPDGTRVRRITSIKRLNDVSPVVDPAFASQIVAFSKESQAVTEQITEPAAEPKAPPAAPEPKAEAPKAKFSQAETFEATEAFARTIETDQIEQAMDAIVASAKGSLKGVALDQYEAYAKIYNERKKVDSETRERAERMEALHNIRLGRIPKAPVAVELYESDDYKHAFTRYLRTGDKNIMEQFAQSIAGDGTEGGFAVPESFLTRITERRKAFGGVQRYAEEITTSDGRALPWPTNDDTGNSAAIATEGSAVASGGADLVFGEISLSAYTYDATGTSNTPLAVSKELIQDAAFDIEGFVSRKLGERLGRKIAADLATADGSGKPKGLFNKSADVMTATTMYAALVEHSLQVDQAYRESGNCRWLMSDTVFAKVLTSVDGNGRPLFIPSGESGGQAGPSGFLLGYPLALDQGAGSSVAFGDINAGYIVRNVRGVTVDVDPYTLISKRQIAFHAWARVDGQIQDTYAVSVSSYSGVSADS